MLTRLNVPNELHRNAPKVRAKGIEHTGQTLIDLAIRTVGLRDLSRTDVLDIGCGVRFTQTFINQMIPVQSYTGMKVHKPIADFLQKEVQLKDRRFHFALWNVQNDAYNPKGEQLSHYQELPITGKFDLIWLFFGTYTSQSYGCLCSAEAHA